jgi:hypothetical protein
LSDVLIEILGEGVADHPGIAFYRRGLFDDAYAIWIDGTLLLQVVQYTVLETTRVYLPVRDRLRRGIVAVGVGEVPKVRPVVYAPASLSMIAGYNEPEVLETLPNAKSSPLSSETSCT